MKDEFLSQGGHAQSTTLVKDAALKYYMSQLGNPNLVIYHMKLSCNGYMPVFTLKPCQDIREAIVFKQVQER